MTKNTKNRVVVTGLGVVSSIGIGVEEFWPNCLAGKSGISKVETFDTSDYERHIAGEIKNFDPTKFMNAKRTRQMGRASQLAIAASKLAIKDAHLTLYDLCAYNAGVCMGTTMGEPQVMERIDEKLFPHGKDLKYDRVSSFSYPSSAIANNVAIHFKLSGKTLVFSTACASGNYSLGEAFDTIHAGEADLMLAGGADALSRIAFTGFGRLFAIAPEKCQPFDVNRRGMLLGEGSAVLVCESFERAKKRGARMYAEVIGYGLSCDAHHMTQPKREGIAKAMEKALKNSCIEAKDVNYICAHGTGTLENDKNESRAICDVLGPHKNRVYVNSIKSMLGHTMGAASAIESVNCCKSIFEDIIAPTINFEEKDPECDVIVVANEKIEKTVNVVLNNASAFGGNNCCVAFKKVV